MRSVAGKIETASYGTVILAGTVHSRAEHDAAVAVTWSARGVTEVDDRIVAETQGNPLALLELPRGLSPSELAGGLGVPGAAPLP